MQPVLGQVGEPARSAARGERGRNGRPSIQSRPASSVSIAEDAARDLGAARADEAGEADDLAAAELERDVGEDAAAGSAPLP